MFKNFKLPKVNLLVQLLFVLLIAFLFGNKFSLEHKRFFYTLSMQLQEILVFMLPFVIFSYLFACLVNFENNVLVFILALLGLVVFSNGMSNIYSYGVGHICFSYFANISKVVSTVEPLQPMDFIFRFYKIPNNYALFSGAIIGIFFFYYKHPRALRLADSMKRASTFFLRNLFIPVMPLFIFGFMLKMEHDGLLAQVVTSYAPIMVVAVTAQCLYIAFMFMVAARFRFNSWVDYIKNAVPSMVTGFTTMSSALTMPLVLQGAEKSSGEPKIVQACVPATINIHTVGDSIMLPLLIMATMLTFGYPIPTFSTYIVFTGYYVVQKFAGATVPGGGVMLVMPILQGLFDFTPTMQGFITAVYMLFDPFLTAGNVSANGALAIIFARLFGGKKEKCKQA